jgi:hypothetical protein
MLLLIAFCAVVQAFTSKQQWQSNRPIVKDRSHSYILSNMVYYVLSPKAAVMLYV